MGKLKLVKHILLSKKNHDYMTDYKYGYFFFRQGLSSNIPFEALYPIMEALTSVDDDECIHIMSDFLAYKELPTHPIQKSADGVGLKSSPELIRVKAELEKLYQVGSFFSLLRIYIFSCLVANLLNQVRSFDRLAGP